MVALPFLRRTLHCSLPKRGYPKQINHLGDLIKARRLELGQLQRDVGELIGTDSFTVSNWEKGYTPPAVRFYPKIIEYLI
jgi:DNA-binding XRE family transcriptional regulator